MASEALRRSVLRECEYGPEEFFVLVQSVDWRNTGELNGFLEVIVGLVKEGMLRAQCGQDPGASFSMGTLSEYVSRRIANGEDLDEYPETCEEYRFTTTQRGLEWLRGGGKEERNSG